MLGYTHDEIADIEGITRRRVTQVYGNFTNFSKMSKELYQKKHSITEICKRFKLSQNRISEILNLDENISNIETDITNKDKRTKLSSDEEVSVALLAIKGEKHPDTAEEIDKYLDFIEEHSNLLPLTEKAAKPLMREPDEEIREAAIKKISEDAIGKQHAGRGHKKRLSLLGYTQEEIAKIEKITQPRVTQICIYFSNFTKTNKELYQKNHSIQEICKRQSAISPPYYHYFGSSYLSLKFKIKNPIQHSRIIT